MKPLSLKEFSELTKIAYHTLYKYKASYTGNDGKVDIKKFTKFIVNGGLPRLSNRAEVIEACQLNSLPKLAKLLGQTQPLNLYQLGELSGIAYHTLLSQWDGNVTIENFLKLIESGKWQKIGNREEVRVKALENSVTDSNKELWLKIAELMKPKKKRTKRKQCRIMLTQANWEMLGTLAELRHDKSKVNAFVKAIDELALTFQLGDTKIEATKTWRPKLPLPVIDKMDEIIINHLVHLEPLGKADGHKLVANWAIEGVGI